MFEQGCVLSDVDLKAITFHLIFEKMCLIDSEYVFEEEWAFRT